MGWVEILVIVLTVLAVGAIIGVYIYKKIKHLPTGDCGDCSSDHKGSRMVKSYNKKYHKKDCQCKNDKEK